MFLYIGYIGVIRYIYIFHSFEVQSIMKKLCVLFLALYALSAEAFAKSVDVATARTAGYNFISGKSAEGIREPEDLQLVYTTIAPQAASTYCYYVFNAGSHGFIIVSAEDQVKPILGYSTESLFNPNNIPTHFQWWLQQYTDQIGYVIEHQLTADAEVAGEWKQILTSRSTSQNKTTAVSPMLTTTWNQNPYYNALCPTDGSQNAVTGCVATTMAQIMKFWSYPAKGTGSSSYNHPDFGMLSANFATTTYNWSSMPNQLSSGSTSAQIQAVATLMYHAGVAVQMDYGINGSAAQSIGSGPSAESALKTYFGYMGANGISRSSYSTTMWKSTLQGELDKGRPVYYAGTDPAQGAGHAWVADGYDGSMNLHMNWGWNGLYNGYFSVDNLVPGTGGTGSGTGNFTANQRAIIGIQAPGALTPDKYESNNASADASVVSATGFNSGKGVTSIDANFHNASDLDYYEVQMPFNSHKFSVTARVHDLKNSGNSKTYTVDAKFAANTNKLGLSTYNDVSMPTSLTVPGGSSAFFKVVPVTTGATGTYLLEVTVTDIATGVEEVTSVQDVKLYPNPASNVLHIDLGGIKADKIALSDVTGRTILEMNASGKSTVDMDVKNVTKGNYLVTIHSGTTRINKQVSILK